MVVVHKKSQTIDFHKTDEKGKPLKGKQFLTLLDIFKYFDEHDTFIFNNTKVFPARLYGTKEKTDAKIEVFLLRELNQEMRLWDVLVEPARKIRIGNKLFFDESGSLVAEVIDNTTSRGRTLRFLYDCLMTNSNVTFLPSVRHLCHVTSLTIRGRTANWTDLSPMRILKISSVCLLNMREPSRHLLPGCTSHVR